MDDDLAMESSFNLHSRQSSGSSQEYSDTPGLKRSKRQSLFHAPNMDSTPKAATVAGTIAVATPIEPLSIKKKTSVRSSTASASSPTPVRKIYTRTSPHNRTLQKRIVSPRRVSPEIRKAKAGPSTSFKSEELEQAQTLSITTKDHVNS